MGTEFPLGAKVRFTQKRLSILTPRDRQGLAGRIGITQTDGARVSKPTVYFPKDGANLELRLFRVDPSHLELVEIPPNVEEMSSGNGRENLFERSPGPAHAKTTAPGADDGGTLSPNDIDNLFD
ncbi:MAG: hypothetical protein K9K38_02730 [Rhodoferax sp.]|nr:hypothetical protein [Rhodoferax sp.]MCF8208307.1 hypothetical protein [Rhodoferax sp.]